MATSATPLPTPADDSVNSMAHTDPFDGADALEIDVQIDEIFAGTVDADLLAAAARAALQQQAWSAGTLAIVVTSDEAVQQLNRDYRGVDAPTDVLSFAAQDEDESASHPQGAPPELAALLAAQLGDVIIALPYAARQAQRFGNSLDAELRLLAVHGVLHLLGYEHDTAEEEAAMWAAQEEILAPFGVRGLSHRDHEQGGAVT